MRILFDSKKRIHKDPFGTLIPGEICTVNVHVPTNVGAERMECVLRCDNTGAEQLVSMLPSETKGAYTVFTGSFQLTERGLYFY